MPPCHVPAKLAGLPSPPIASLGSTQPPSIDDILPNRPTSYPELCAQSPRTLLILDRFSVHCSIDYCSNDCVLSTTAIMGRPFYDFVAPKDEGLVRSWIETCKGWGVNERGQPSDGGFGFGKFSAYVSGRDSRWAFVLFRSSRLLTIARSERASPPQVSKRPDPYHKENANGKTPRSKRGIRALPPVLAKVRPENEILVDVIFSAHSDGLMVILRKA